MTQKYRSVISLDNLLVKVNLGVTDAEKNTPQDAKVSFKLYFTDKPGGCTSDNVDDTVCYHKIAGIVEECCKNGEFRLLEYLCYNLHEKIRSVIDKDTKLWVKVEKCNPPIYGLVGATAFEYSDL